MVQMACSKNNIGNVSLNVYLSAPQSYSVQNDGSHTPNTPEILNAIVNMQSFGTENSMNERNVSFVSNDMQMEASSGYGLPMDSMQPLEQSNSPSSSSSTSSEMFSQTWPCEPKLNRSQYIKEGLKQKVKARLRSESDSFSSLSPAPSVDYQEEKPKKTFASGETSPKNSQPKIKSDPDNLSDEDMLRRQRRRERNKIAATKCRNKRKMKVQMLVKDFETVGSQNIQLRAEVEKLEKEKKRLQKTLEQHQKQCIRNSQSQLPIMSVNGDEDHNQLSSNFTSSENKNIESLSLPVQNYFNDCNPEEDDLQLNDVALATLDSLIADTNAEKKLADLMSIPENSNTFFGQIGSPLVGFNNHCLAM